jgi:hypothetical protein
VVGVLIRMKLVLLRNSMTGVRAALMVIGGLSGLILATGTLLLSIVLSARSSALMDILALIYTVWLLGWIVGPILVGGQSGLRPDHFTLLPIPRLRLALGLLGTAFIDIGTGVTLLAFASLVVFAARLGMGPTFVAVPAVALQLLFVLFLARVVVTLFRRTMQSRIGGAIAGIVLAAILFVLQGQWVVIVAISESGVLGKGLPSSMSTLVRALPSSWGLVAVQAAAQANWLLAVTTLVGLVAVVALLFVGWSHLLALPGAARAIVRGSSGNAAQESLGLRQKAFSGRTMGVLVKEVRTWWRDPSRTMKIVLPLSWALIWCVLPLTFGAKLQLPFAAPALALMALASSANLYGDEGTALWLTLVTPRAARHDVRGRQWAWLVIFAPLTITVAVLFTALSGQNRAWPWILALVPALLGGGAGLLLLISVLALAPGPDPRQGRANPFEQGTSGGQAIYLFFLGLLPALPALAAVLAGTVLKNAVLLWAGTPISIGTGIVLPWWFGRLASRRLETRGPELLSLMRSGKSNEAKAPDTKATGARPTFLSTMPRWKSILFLLCPSLGSIALIPQGLVPLLIKLSGSSSRVWFLALYLPTAWQWPVIVSMLLLGLGILGAMIPLYLSHKKVWQRLQTEKGFIAALRKDTVEQQENELN